MTYQVIPAKVRADDGTEIHTSMIEWGEKGRLTSKDVTTSDDGDDNKTSFDERSRAAILWLQDKLKDGSRAKAEIEQEAEAAGISRRALSKARQDLHVVTKKSGWQGGGTLALPEAASGTHH